MNTEEAAKLAGNSKSTILRDIKNGKLSAERKGRGWDIQAAELARVYQLAIDADASVTRQVTRHDASPDVTDSSGFQAQLEAARAMIEERGQTIEDLRSRLDRSEEKRAEAEEERATTQRQLTALLTDQRSPSEQPQEAPKGSRTNYPLWGLVLAGFGFVIWWVVASQN